MANEACATCKAPIDYLTTFPGGICVNCHAKKVDGQDATQMYNDIMGGFSSKVVRVQNLRRSNAAGPIPSKKAYKRKPKHPKADNE